MAKGLPSLFLTLYICCAFLLLVGCSPSDGGATSRSDNQEMGGGEARCHGWSRKNLAALSLTFCEIGTNGVPIGGGMLLRRGISGKREHFVVTARHVLKEVEQSNCKLWIGVPGTNGLNCVNTDFVGATLSPSFRRKGVVHGENGADIVAVKIPDEWVDKFTDGGAAFLDAEGDSDHIGLKGVRICQAADAERSGIGVGSPVFAMVMSHGLWEIQKEKSASAMMSVTGAMAKMPMAEIRLGDESYGKCYIISETVVPGSSGGPVFAMADDGSVSAIGVISAKMPYLGKTDIDKYIFPPGAIVTPFDELENSFSSIEFRDAMKRMFDGGRGETR